MKLSNLNVKGFRSFKQISWSPCSFNIIIGPNGSGKSNLLKLFDLIKRSADGELEDYILREGGFERLLWDGLVDEIDVTLRFLSAEEEHDIFTEDLMYQLLIRKTGYAGDYQIKSEILGYSNIPPGTTEHFRYLQRTPSSASLQSKDENAIFPFADMNPKETLLSQTTTPFTKNHVSSRFQNMISSWKIYQSLDTSPESVIRRPTVTRRDTNLAGDGTNLISVLHTLYTTDREFEKSIDMAMVAAFGEDFDTLVFPPAADNQVQLRIRWKTVQQEQSAADISDGTLRYLFLLTILAHPKPGSLIAIDEPETGLHPAMMRIIAEYAEEISKQTQVVITTHSAEFLTACSDCIPCTSVIQWQDGASIIHQISEEKLTFWLQDYTLGTLFSTGELEGME